MPATPDLPSTTDMLFNLPCEIEQVRQTVRAARAFLAAKGVPERELMSCELALAEACNNAVLYAKPLFQFDSIEIELICDDSTIEMRVHDHTAGFDLPQKVELVDHKSENGRGIFIMQSLMDEVTYANGINENTLTLRKYRLPSAPVEKFFREDDADTKMADDETEQIISEMAEELSSCYESLSAIFRSGAELGKTDNLQQFSRSLCEDLLQITSANWFLLRIVPKDETVLTTFVSSATNLEIRPISTSNLENDLSVEARAAAHRKDTWFDPQTPLAEKDPLQLFQRGGVGMVHPFYFNEMLIGTLAIGKTSGQRPFTAANVNVVHTFADFLAIQIVNARLREEQLNNRLVTHELEIAQGIQRALLPKELPRLREFGIAAFCASARHVGGDFYDVVRINEHSALLIIADVMGKGVPAAMFAAILRSVLRGAPELASQPASLMSRVNRLLFEDLSEVEMFITVQLAFVDVQARKIIVASAGHSPALLVSGETPIPKLISPEGMPLGILRDAVFLETREKLPRNSRLLIYTDGLTEARNPSGQMFGNAHLENWLKQSEAICTAEQLKESLAGRLRNFQGHATPNDDQTFLILAEET